MVKKTHRKSIHTCIHSSAVIVAVSYIHRWNGNVYKGDFVDEKLTGQGELAYARGHRYDS